MMKNALKKFITDWDLNYITPERQAVMKTTTPCGYLYILYFNKKIYLKSLPKGHDKSFDGLIFTKRVLETNKY